MADLSLDTMKDGFSCTGDKIRMLTQGNTDPPSESKNVSLVGQKENGDKVNGENWMKNAHESMCDKLNQTNKMKQDLSNRWEKRKPQLDDQAFYDHRSDITRLRSFGVSRPGKDGEPFDDEFKNFSTCRNSFEGRMRSELKKKGFKDPKDQTDQGLVNETKSSMNYFHPNRGRQKDWPRQENRGFGMRNDGKFSFQIDQTNGSYVRNYRCCSFQIDQANGSLVRNCRGNQRKYSFEEFTQKLFNGKLPTLQPESNDEEKKKNDLKVNQTHESENDKNSSSSAGLSNVRGKGNLIPRVLLIGKGNPPTSNKKPLIKNEELDVVEDKFVSFDTEESSDEDEFFTPNTSLEEIDSDEDSKIKWLIEKTSNEATPNTGGDFGGVSLEIYGGN